MYLPAGATAAADEAPNPDPRSGLVVRRRGGAVVPVRSHPGQVMFQAGLALQVLSGGRLRATQHAVLAPQHAQHGLTRSTFVVFCQPKCASPASLLKASYALNFFLLQHRSRWTWAGSCRTAQPPMRNVHPAARLLDFSYVKVLAWVHTTQKARTTLQLNLNAQCARAGVGMRVQES